MKKIILILTLAALLLLGACSGSEDTDKDTQAPATPKLRPHLGDTGDPRVQYPPETGPWITLTDENNGIDAVPDGNWIRVPWEPFTDNDLSHVKIYRFDHFNPEPLLIDSVSATAQYYLDNRIQLDEGVWYSYFIDLVDMAGNSSRSDTVSYALLSKCIPVYPEQNQVITPTQGTFQWYRSGEASLYRVLLMDEDGNYVGHQDLYVATEENPLHVVMPNTTLDDYIGRSLRWRVDAFDWDAEMEQYKGSESHEYIVNIQ